MNRSIPHLKVRVPFEKAPLTITTRGAKLRGTSHRISATLPAPPSSASGLGPEVTLMSTSNLPVAVIGAGPVGLAAAAHLIERGETPTCAAIEAFELSPERRATREERRLAGYPPL